MGDGLWDGVGPSPTAAVIARVAPRPLTALLLRPHPPKAKCSNRQVSRLWGQKTSSGEPVLQRR